MQKVKCFCTLLGVIIHKVICGCTFLDAMMHKVKYFCSNCLAHGEQCKLENVCPSHSARKFSDFRLAISNLRLEFASRNFGSGIGNQESEICIYFAASGFGFRDSGPTIFDLGGFQILNLEFEYGIWTSRLDSRFEIGIGNILDVGVGLLVGMFEFGFLNSEFTLIGDFSGKYVLYAFIFIFIWIWILNNSDFE